MSAGEGILGPVAPGAGSQGPRLDRLGLGGMVASSGGSAAVGDRPGLAGILSASSPGSAAEVGRGSS